VATDKGSFNYTDNFFAVEQIDEAISYGFNVELGGMLYECPKFLLYGAVGPYCFFHTDEFHKTFPGFEVRLRPQLADYAAVDLRYSYDSLFKSIFETQFIIYFPVYNKRVIKAGCLSSRQIYQPVERIEAAPLIYRSRWGYNW
jgi:hypothetical protein